jgi:hypothetical protein
MKDAGADEAEASTALKANWWRRCKLRRLSACCIELQRVRICSSATVTIRKGAINPIGNPNTIHSDSVLLEYASFWQIQFKEPGDLGRQLGHSQRPTFYTDETQFAYETRIYYSQMRVHDKMAVNSCHQFLLPCSVTYGQHI